MYSVPSQVGPSGGGGIEGDAEKSVFRLLLFLISLLRGGPVIGAMKLSDENKNKVRNVKQIRVRRFIHIDLEDAALVRIKGELGL